MEKKVRRFQNKDTKHIWTEMEYARDLLKNTLACAAGEVDNIVDNAETLEEAVEEFNNLIKNLLIDYDVKELDIE